MLIEPEQNPRRRELDRALIEAIRARMAEIPRGSVDAEALGLRQILQGLSGSERQAVRGLMGRIEATQVPPLVCCGPLSHSLAADRWGLGHRGVAEPDQALKHGVQGGRALIDLGDRPWWGRLLALPGLGVIGTLPDDAAGLPRALLVSKEATGPTGDDRTFWVTDSPLSADKISTALSEQGLFASLMISAGGLKLFVLTGYVQAEDPRLIDAPGRLSGVIGTAPVF